MVVESSQSLLSPLGSFKPSRGGVCVCYVEREGLYLRGLFSTSRLRACWWREMLRAGADHTASWRSVSLEEFCS